MRCLGRLPLLLLAFGCLLMGVVPVRASEWHQFDIINNSSHTLRITGALGRCVSAIQSDTFIYPGSRTTFKWNDANDAGLNCTNKDKFVGFTFSLGSGQTWNGWLGMTHRKLSGSTWYNGQFYAGYLALTIGSGEMTYYYEDGGQPPGWIQALCSNNNNCFGPFSEMEDKNKDDYNWDHSFQTESGWAFQINNPY